MIQTLGGGTWQLKIQFPVEPFYGEQWSASSQCAAGLTNYHFEGEGWNWAIVARTCHRILYDHVACALIQDEDKMIQDYSRYLESLESAVHGMCNWLYSCKHLSILHCQLQ